MAELTVELRHLLQSDFELFDFTYQFDDPKFKAEIEQALINRFYFNEIGQETPDRFKHRFMTRFKRIIPYYNNLHNTTLLSYNPLVNYTINEGLNQLAEATNNQENTGVSTSSQDSTTISTNTGSTISDTDATSTTDTTGNTLTTNDTQTLTDGSTTSTTNEKGSDYPDTPIAGATFLAEEKQSTGSSTNDSLSKNTGTVDTDNTSHSEGMTSNSGTTSSKDDGSSTNESTLTGSTKNDIVTRGTTTSNYEKTIEGLTGTSYQNLIRQERDNLTRIIDSIIEEMKPSFYLIY